MAISTAVFPTLAGQAARDEEQALAATLARSLGVIVFLTLPVSVGLLFLARPLVVLLLQRGAFGEASTDLTARALTFYAIGLVGHTTIEILSRGFYALRDTRTPVALAVAAMVLNVALAAALVEPLGVRGLALALSIAALVEASLLLVFLRRRLVLLALEPVLASGLRALVAAGAMAAVMALVQAVLDRDAGTTAGATVSLVGAGGAGGLAYVVASYLLGSSELGLLTSRWRPSAPGPPG
jgi:putative peptidoglycan lipid II flippase